MGGARPNLLGAAAAASIILSNATGPTWEQNAITQPRSLPFPFGNNHLSCSIDVSGHEGLQEEEVELAVLGGCLVNGLDGILK